MSGPSGLGEVEAEAGSTSDPAGAAGRGLVWPVVLLQHQALKPAGPSATLRVGGSERLRMGLTQALLQASVQAACALVGALPASSLAF